MNIESINKVYFLGIGGIGMSALARYFMQNNISVYGYDRSPSPLTTALMMEGAEIIFEDDIHLLPQGLLENKDTLFIYTPAIPKNNTIFQYFKSLDKELYKRSEILGLLSKKYKCIGVAGTHGKTTVSSMTAHLMHHSATGCQAFLGGILIDYNSNLITNESSHWMVVEADEYDRSFLQLHPFIGLITSMDADHLDIYGHHAEMENTFIAFANQIDEKGALIINSKLEKYFTSHYKSYSLNDTSADFHAIEIELKDGLYHFHLVHPKGIIRDLKLYMPGQINLENAVAASAIAIESGLKPEEIRNALANFKGIKRRMELIFKNEECIYYDDYAHHPEEIKASLHSLKKLYPNKKLTLIFQPHLYSRTRDFQKGFAESLSIADQIILLDIYPAREEPIADITSKIILNKISKKDKIILEKEEVIPYLQSQKLDLLVTLGAGDIDRLVEPIKQSLS